MRQKAHPTQERLRYLFRYRKSDAALIRIALPSPSYRKPLGIRAGGPHNDGYRQIRVDGVRYLEHRIIWIHQNGDIPEDMQIDHVNGIRDCNLLENLRLVTPLENSRNQRPVRKKSGMPPGVVQHPSGFVAVVAGDKGHEYLGLFKSPAAAHRAYRAALKKYGFHPNHGKHVAG
jgi:hypothetical protein